MALINRAGQDEYSQFILKTSPKFHEQAPTLDLDLVSLVTQRNTTSFVAH